ncbi:Glycosyltransferase involved in cell wall bisynthesis [Flavobacterium gillisiae]|uniref:Glycosyltransferase involved in cell wall bisynthesis n=1 Tax=Flavobacterium gillisiae TaxID=150146 RepID=A0A1H3ZQY1_9FLAO|nr:glycosyltransferase family 4 protein [Flavobacterium gillisiae]SEA26120.1 Glycosyltransferase involved in cell wall bisynthesis [Flavobacterium gillisiae]
MNIGIAGPIEIACLKKHLPNVTEEECKLGLGGTAVNVLIDGLINEGHHVTVFTLDYTIESKYSISGPNLKVIIGHCRTRSKMKWFDCWKAEILQIKQFIDEEKSNIDIVNAHWSYEYAIGTILADVPHLITFRDHAQTKLKLTKQPYRLTRLLMDRWVRNNAKHFSYNSMYLSVLINLKGMVIPNPIQDAEIKTARKHPSYGKKIKICYIANGWDSRKNPKAAIEAFYIAQKTYENCELHLIGSGFEPAGANYNLVQKKGWSKNVHFRGKMNRSRLMEELQHFDILLHTAREQSFGNILIEAMSKGIPVIGGKDAGAVPWILDDGYSGCLTDVKSPKIVAEHIIRLIVDGQYYEKLSRNGIINLQTSFSQEIVCKQYIKEYNSILELSC